MRMGFPLTATLIFGASGLFGANQSWKGTISDSMCGGSHPTGEHNGKTMTARQCILKSDIDSVPSQSVAELEAQDHFGNRVALLTGSSTGMRQGRILVVEDDDTLRRVTQMHLEKQGYSTAAAADAFRGAEDSRE